jgi:hypothetical protein
MTIEVEAKAKELAVMKLMKELNTDRPQIEANVRRQTSRVI